MKARAKEKARERAREERATNGQTQMGRGKGKEKATAGGSADVDALAGSMDALSLVPPSIQFGRGARRGPLQGARNRGGRANGDGPDSTAGRADGAPMEVDHPVRDNIPDRGTPGIIRGGAMRGFGRGRGRGRGGGGGTLG